MFLKVSAPYYWTAYLAQIDLNQNHFSPSDTAANVFHELLSGNHLDHVLINISQTLLQFK
jgi:hypothetical protein